MSVNLLPVKSEAAPVGLIISSLRNVIALFMYARFISMLLTLMSKIESD